MKAVGVGLVLVIAILLLAVVVAFLVGLVRHMRSTRRVTVVKDVRFNGPLDAVERSVSAALESVGGAIYLPVAPGMHALVLRRIPVWVAIPCLLLFPIGLVFLFIREDVRLDVAVFDDGTGPLARMSGRSEADVLEQVRGALIAAGGVG